MNTAPVPVTAAQKLNQHGGAWYPLDNHLFKKRIERMTELIGHIDATKHCIPDQVQLDKIAEAVALVHTVAMYYDQLHNWDIYSHDDIECQAVQQ